MDATETRARLLGRRFDRFDHPNRPCRWADRRPRSQGAATSVSVLQSSEFGQPIILHLLWEATATECKPLLTLTSCRLAFAGANAPVAFLFAVERYWRRAAQRRVRCLHPLRR